MCDCDAPQAFYSTERKARVQHQCCECFGPIEVGQKYEYASGIWDGRASSYKTCLRCAGVRKWYVAEALPKYECGPCFGELWQDATDHGNSDTVQGLTEAAAVAGYV
jgi:hypothetical protein